MNIYRFSPNSQLAGTKPHFPDPVNTKYELA